MTEDARRSAATAGSDRRPSAHLSAREFLERASQGQLQGLRCGACGETAIPPKEFCPACGARAWELITLSGEGTVASYTVIRVAPRRFAAEAPYALAQVRLAEGVALLGRLVDIPLESLSIGLPVRFRPLASGERTAIAFGPA